MTTPTDRGRRSVLNEDRPWWVPPAGTVVYISGPMTGLPAYNCPAFAATQTELARWGCAAVSPHNIGQRDGWEWGDYMDAAMAMLDGCAAS